MNYTNDLSEAQKILGRAYVKASSKLRKLTRQTDQQMWFLQLIVNCCIAHTKQRKWRTKVDAVASDSSVGDIAINLPEDEEGVASAFQRELFDALQKLKRWHRMIFILRFYEDLPVATIATVTGRGEKFIRRSLLRSVERIQLGKF